MSGLTNAHSAATVRSGEPRGRGGIGRRAGFRSRSLRGWGFESLRPHKIAVKLQQCFPIGACPLTFLVAETPQLLTIC